MKTIAIIPSRYGSTRFPGKPLALIKGKPMIEWVVENVKKTNKVDDVYVATDDSRVYDAVQAFGKLPIKAESLGVDLLSVSGHKIHAPKGIGALYIKSGVHIKPLLLGGGQENGMRSGTESVPLISAFGAAVEELPDINKQLNDMQSLCDYAKNVLIKTGVVTVNSKEDSLPYILNISVPGFRSETLLHFLESKGIFVSSGSACSKGKGSYVLSEFGLKQSLVDSALRISFSRYNTKADADELTAALLLATKSLRRSDI